jgi:hypothetical protein
MGIHLVRQQIYHGGEDWVTALAILALLEVATKAFLYPVSLFIGSLFLVLERHYFLGVVFLTFTAVTFLFPIQNGWWTMNVTIWFSMVVVQAIIAVPWLARNPVKTGFDVMAPKFPASGDVIAIRGRCPECEGYGSSGVNACKMCGGTGWRTRN